MNTDRMYPYLTIRDAIAEAANLLARALEDTGDAFRYEGTDHAPDDFAASTIVVAQVVATLREQAGAIKMSADAEQERYDADDDYWSRDK